MLQTPQCFRRDILFQALDSGLTHTDEIGLVRKSIPGAQIELVTGDVLNMKLTTPADLKLLEFYLDTL